MVKRGHLYISNLIYGSSFTVSCTVNTKNKQTKKQLKTLKNNLKNESMFPIEMKDRIFIIYFPVRGEQDREDGVITVRVGLVP